MNVADTLDPDLVAALGALRERGLSAPPPQEAGLAAAREGYDRVGAFLSGLVPAEGDIHERPVTLSGDDGGIPALFLSRGGQTRGRLLVYLHGGGFALGRACDWSGMAREVVRAGFASVLLVDYRLAPEAPFPAGLSDACAALRQAADAAGGLGFEVTRTIAGGDSAGANLALAATQMLEPAARPDGLLLYYGVFSGRVAGGDWERLGRLGLSSDLMRWIWQTYIGVCSPEEPRATPLDGDMEGLPPVVQVVGTLDPLARDATDLHRVLDRAGCPNRLSLVEGLPHGFIRMGPMVPLVARTLRASLAEMDLLLPADGG